MRRETMDRGVGVERPDADRAIATAGDECGIAQLELPDQGGVPLEGGEALPSKIRMSVKRIESEDGG